MNPQIILASTSPRRKELLSAIIEDFQVIPSPGEEIHCHQTPLPDLCCVNAQSKASAIAGRSEHEHNIVIGADTLVYIDSTPLGKPHNRVEAIATLKKLSGRTHQVCTGVCIIHDEHVHTFHEITEVSFKILTDELIETYLEKVDVMDKAGSYAIQEYGDMIIHQVTGCYTNVVGFPQEAVRAKLIELGVKCLPEKQRVAENHRYPVLFNPSARSTKGRRALRFLMANATDFVLYATRDIDDARELAAKFAADEEPVILAAGGDGTLNAVIMGLIGSNTALGVLPTGTMNVFAREMGIPVPNVQRSNLNRALQVIKQGHITEVDLFHANGQPFVQMAGVGFDAQVIEDTTIESKKLLGPLAYLKSAVKLLGDNPPKMKLICSDGREIEGVAVLAGNGELYGGQVRLFPKADNNDGLLDILVFKETGYKFVVDTLKGIAGVLDLVTSSVEYVQAAEFKVVADRDVPIEVDGEYLGRHTEVSFSSTGSKLKVLAPKEPIGGFAKVWKDWVQNIPRKFAGE
ncbi:MAG: Maf family nucleotide pyrophosphatase [Akkermansiaceae bacterium]